MKFNKSLLLVVMVVCSAMDLRVTAQDHLPKDATIPKTVRQFLEWEWYANAANKPEARKSPQAFKLQHLEIPLEYVEQQMAEDLSPAIRGSLIFKKDGKQYVRWIINPEDTHYANDLAEYFRSRGIQVTRGQFFNGYLTASRSIIIENPKTGTVFSGKVSTDNTGGAWQDKGVTFNQANKARIASDYLQSVEKTVPLRNLKLLYEPVGLTVRGAIKGGDLNQSLIIRDLDEMARGEKYYLPAFSAIHTAEGAAIAKLNGSDDPEKFWRRHLVVPLAKGFAEFAAYAGLSYESAHAQQYLIELDQNKRPTGRLVLRDFPDSYAFDPAFDKRNAQHKFMLDQWLEHYRKNDMEMRFGLFKDNNKMPRFFRRALGLNNAPKWLSKVQMEEWSEVFFENFVDTYSKITKVPKSKLVEKGHAKTTGTVTSYRTKTFFSGLDLKGSDGRPFSYWLEYFEAFPCFQGAEKTKSGQSCQEVLAKLRERVGPSEQGQCRR